MDVLVALAGWPPVQLVARPCLVQRLLAAGGCGQVLAWLAACPGESQSCC